MENVFTPLMNEINNEEFNKTIDQKSVKLYSIFNDQLGIKITNYGARVIGLCVPDKYGKPTDIVIGYKTIDDYLKSNEKYFGCVIGRCANRIRDAKFAINNKEYFLDKNKGKDHLHGGLKGFGDVVWDAKQITSNKVVFEYLSVDMEGGYPGNLNIVMSYEITEDCEFKISYEAETDKTTICNLSHHSFFNLNGEESTTINDHILQINADAITEVDESVIPTGKYLSVKNTPMDFTTPFIIGDRINEKYDQLVYANGYDHNWILNKKNNSLFSAATVYSTVSGIQMDVLTTKPGLQFYSGNYLNGKDLSKNNKPILRRSAFALETQGFPNSPNTPEFPSVVLNSGDKYKSVTVYKFSKQS